jgi:hypothetical protein
MNKKIKITVILAILVIAAVVLSNSLSLWGDKTSDTAFEYNLEEFKKVDESLIKYREARQISIESGEPKAFTYHNGNIFLLTGGHLQIITPDGRELLKKAIDTNPHRISIASDGTIVIAYENYLVSYNQNGEKIKSSELFDNSLFTAVAVSGESVFVADAGEKQIVVFDMQMEKTGSFKGESGVSLAHGFILPSLHFDLAVNNDEELWVVNPGLHSIQNYSASGRFRGQWGEPSFNLSGFSGCCNPSYFAFLSDGRYVTSEKGIIRVKVHKPSGEFESVVASAEKFPNGSLAPALAVDENDNVLILDFDKKMIRLFRPIN